MNLFHSFLAAIVKKTLIKYEYYDLLLTNEEMILLEEIIELLEVFEVFTKYVQGEYYCTLNSIVLFRTEIVDR